MKKLLHVGCGTTTINNLKGFDSSWNETRLDIDPQVNPDIISSGTDLKCIGDNEFEAIYSSHSIEHVYFHEVKKLLDEFYRVLTPNGFVIITCPDLRSISKVILDNDLDTKIYDSEVGPIYPMDVIFGSTGHVSRGNMYMAHKCGFTFELLTKCLFNSKFKKVVGGARSNLFDIWAIGFKEQLPHDDENKLVNKFLP